MFNHEGQWDIPVYPARQTVDPTGAGDAYRAGLLAGLSRGLSMRASAHLGAWISAKSVEHKGTQNHRIEPEGLEALLKKL